MLLESIQAEYRRYKTLAESAIAQLSDEELVGRPAESSNSVAMIAWHLSGNLQSRFTDFLTSDGEKPWRHRDAEFASRSPDRDELLAYWEKGWRVLDETLTGLSDEDLARTVTIRQQPLEVHAALHRSLAHATYHVGQIVYIAKALRGEQWSHLSIAPGKSEEYNRNPDRG